MPSSPVPCIPGEFRAAFNTLFKPLTDTQRWFVLSQLPSQLEGQSVQRDFGLRGVKEECKHIRGGIHS
ncbi:hypothetical protein V8E55_005257 [Tylopilus felleus]